MCYSESDYTNYQPLTDTLALIFPLIFRTLADAITSAPGIMPLLDTEPPDGSILAELLTSATEIYAKMYVYLSVRVKFETVIVDVDLSA